MALVGGSSPPCCAFHALRAIDPNVRVVLISGYSFTDEAKKISEQGAAGFLVKPVTANDLLETIAEVLNTETESPQP